MFVVLTFVFVKLPLKKAKNKEASLLFYSLKIFLEYKEFTHLFRFSKHTDFHNDKRSNLRKVRNFVKNQKYVIYGNVGHHHSVTFHIQHRCKLRSTCQRIRVWHLYYDRSPLPTSLLRRGDNIVWTAFAHAISCHLHHTL